MTSKRKCAANRRNAQKSTGPVSDEAKARTRLNGLKHGLRSRTQILPGEDPLEFQELREGWLNNLRPRDDAEQELADEVVNAFWMNRRADRALFEHLRARIDQADSREEDEVENDMRQLFWDERGMHGTYGMMEYTYHSKRTSVLKRDDVVHQPPVIVRKLESSAKGCRALADTWRMLRERVEQDLAWQAHEKLKAIRLLGRHPIEAVDDERVSLIFYASFLMRPYGDHAFLDLKTDMGTPELKEFLVRLQLQWPAMFCHAKRDVAKQKLLELANTQLGRLSAKIEMHDQRAKEYEAQRSARLAVDVSPEGERLRRYELACQRRAHRCLDAFWKYRKENGCEEEVFEDVRDGLGAENGAELELARPAADAENMNLPSNANMSVAELHAAREKRIKEMAKEPETEILFELWTQEKRHESLGIPILPRELRRPAVEQAVLASRGLIPPSS